MLAHGRLREAAVHLEVAGHILRSDLEQLLAGHPAASLSLTSGGASGLGVAEAGEGAQAAYRVAESAAAQLVQRGQAVGRSVLVQGQRPDCLVRRNLCAVHAMLQQWGSAEERRQQQNALTDCLQAVQAQGCGATGPQGGSGSRAEGGAHNEL